jgi:predicted O-methyltransferase YrrM
MKLVTRASARVRGLMRGLITGIGDETRLLNDKLRDVLRLLDKQNSLLSETIERLNDQTALLDDKLMAMIHRQNAQIELQKAEIGAMRAAFSGSAHAVDFPIVDVPPLPDNPIEELLRKRAFASARSKQPLMFAPKTFNTAHPKYYPALVRNFAGKIFNADQTLDNDVFASIAALAQDGEVADLAWDKILKDAFTELATVPQSHQVFERQAYIEDYLDRISREHGAFYAAGWVNRDDALFLYWLVRQLNPKMIVQTGVSNGLSSAFMVLALVKNGAGGRLRAIDLPAVFNPDDPSWTVKGTVYGVAIPQGKSSGWMVPDAYRDRIEVWSGDAKALMPKLVDEVDSIDLFFHDSDHTYDHMMFEFQEAKRKLNNGGLVVADDVSWNASVWDFADEWKVPAYNFRGTIGVAFF